MSEEIGKYMKEEELVKMQSDLLFSILGTTLLEVQETTARAREQGGNIIGYALPLPLIKLDGIPVVFSSNVTKVEALVSANQGARSNEVQTDPLSTPTPSNRNVEDDAQLSLALGDGNGKDGRDDKHTPPPIPESRPSKTDPDSESACNFI